MAAIHSRKQILLAIALVCISGSVAQAAPLDFSGTPAQDAAQQLNEKYGIHIVFKGDFKLQSPVTFSLTNADADGARLQAISSFANAVGADYQKSYIVSKADTDSTNVPADLIDNNAIVVFPSRTLSAQEAIGRIAGVDNAVIQFYGTVADNVTLSATSLNASDAAREVAQQTHTKWKAFYAMTPRGQGRVTGGKIIGRTSSGSPIIEQPYVYYRPQSTPAPPRTASATGTKGSAANAASADGSQGGAQNAGNPFYYGALPFGDSNSGYGYPYGFETYSGNDPYSQNIYPGGPVFGNPYGYGGYGAPDSNGSGLETYGGSGYGAPIVFGGGSF